MWKTANAPSIAANTVEQSEGLVLSDPRETTAFSRDKPLNQPLIS